MYLLKQINSKYAPRQSSNIIQQPTSSALGMQELKSKLLNLLKGTRRSDLGSKKNSYDRRPNSANPETGDIGTSTDLKHTQSHDWKRKDGASQF